MNPIDTVKRVAKAMGVSDARMDEKHKIVVSFHDDRDDADVEEVTEYMESEGWILDTELSYKKRRFRSA